MKKIISALRVHGKAHAHRLPGRSVWLLALAVFLTSVTIAAIIPRDNDTPPANALIPSTPPQTVQLGETPISPATASIEGTPADTQTVRETPDREHWTEVTIRKGDTVSDVLNRNGHDSGMIYRLIQSNPEARTFRQLLPGQTLRLRSGTDGTLQELVYETGPGEAFHLVRHDGHFELTKELRTFETRVAHVTGTIESSLFEDGQDAGLSDNMIMKLVEIFGWDIDFALDLRRGDSFSVIHEEKFWRGQKVMDGDILAAEFVNQGRTFRAIAFRDANGYTSYYAPDGASVRRAFLRTPVEFSRISSRFTNSRYHPILKTRRAHKGVDYAAPTGTPVRSTASGRVLSIGWGGGYGKRIVIRHNATYSTVYAHLSRFRDGLRVGSFVDQGQTIGYVGATGLASGPHLHYEFQVNGVHRNPLTFKFAGGGKIAPQNRDEFARLAGDWSARLDVIGHGTRVAASRQAGNPL
ncbi:peptidase M23 [Sulfuricaulis limicola]|uniref:Peptidase M23 n=1 Tax=Sulfuricaulis limicola TaxID=1620215 RepID=A0A1B4XIJ8_9GAMM|nr:peptidoglycan DD-metalloendopeptidase family protein [Sulfuricaulis limicola]BAV34621.1 peptidase M23 [Sulfuricaulis limicola]